MKREPFFENSSQLFNLIDQNIISGNITASTITDIYYIAKKEIGHNIAIQFIEHILKIVDVVGIDKKIINKALKSDFKDLEDAIQATACELNDIDAIITRNKKDFGKANISIYTPDEFLKLI